MANTKPLASQVRYGVGNSTTVDSVLRKSILTYETEAEIPVSVLPNDQMIEVINTQQSYSISSGSLVLQGPLSGRNETNVLLKRWGAVSGSIGDAATGAQNKLAIQSAIDWVYGNGGGRVIIPKNFYIGSGGIIWRPGVELIGNGPFDSVIYTENYAFRNPGYFDAATQAINEQNFVIRGIGFDGRGVSPAFVNLAGVSDLLVEDYMARNDGAVGNVGFVATGIGIGAGLNANNKNWSFNRIEMDIGDYGIVVTSRDTSKSVDNVEFNNLDITTEWGSCVSIARYVRNVGLDHSKFTVTGSVGIGLKIWEGEMPSGNGPERIAVNDMVIKGPSDYATKTGLQGISVANSAKSVKLTDVDIRNFNDAILANFTGDSGKGIAVVDPTIENCGYAYRADQSSGARLQWRGGKVNGCSYGVYGVLGDNAFIGSGAEFVNVTNTCIESTTNSRRASVSNAFFINSGKEAIKMVNSGSVNDWKITNNTFLECATSSNNTYPVIYMNNQSHTVTGNTVKNEGVNRPSFSIGRDAGSNNCVFGGNWMFGAYGYYSMTTPGDVNYGDKQRGLKT